MKPKTNQPTYQRARLSAALSEIAESARMELGAWFRDTWLYEKAMPFRLWWYGITGRKCARCRKPDSHGDYYAQVRLPGRVCYPCHVLNIRATFLQSTGYSI